MDLWLPLTIAALCFLVAGIIVARRWQLTRRSRELPVLPADAPESPADDAPVKRRRHRIIRSQTPPPPPPPPADVAPDAAAPEEVPFEKLLELVDANIEAGDLANAGHYLEEVRTRFMDKPPLDYYRRKALLSERQGDVAGAAGALESVVALVRDDLEALVHLAELELQLERLADARRRVEEALATQPDHLPLLHVLAKIHRKADEHEQAVAVKQRIHALEQELRLRGELPPDLEELAPTPPPSDVPPAAVA